LAQATTRTVQGLGFIGNSAGQDGRRSAFNDRGELAAFARFTDGSGAILLWDDTFNLPAISTTTERWTPPTTSPGAKPMAHRPDTTRGVPTSAKPLAPAQVH